MVNFHSLAGYAGQVVRLGPQTAHIWKGLDYGQIMVARIQGDYSLAYRQEKSDFVGDQWFPLVDAKFISGLYPKWNLGMFFNDYVTTWRPGTMPAMGDVNLDDHGKFVCQRYACQIPLADDIPYVADPGVDPKFATTAFLTDVMDLHKERVIASQYFQSSDTGGSNVWGTNLNGVTSGENNTSTFRRFDDYIDSDPRGFFKNIKLTVKSKTGKTPNSAVMGEQVYEALRIHPQLIQWYQTGANTVRSITELNEEALAKALGIDRILVGKAMYNTAKPDDDVALDWIFGKHMWVGYIDTPGPMKPLAGMNLSFTEPLGGFNTAFTTVPDMLTHAEYNQAFQCYAPVIMGEKLGAILANAIS